MTVPRQRGRWLTVGVPTVLGGSVGIGSFLLLGVSSLIGGAGLLAPLVAGLGIGIVVGGGAGLLLRNRKPGPVRLTRAAGEMPGGTRPVLEKVVRSTKQERRRLARMRRRASGPVVTPVLNRAETLLHRVDALVGSAALQTRRPSDSDLLMLEGMADRYVPDLMGALEDTVGFLTPRPSEAREQALTNLGSIDRQLVALGAEVDRIEGEIITGVSRSLDVHSEFLRRHLPDQYRDPLADR
ncbi:hypothetical protein BH708_13620 [Brachybacterium sp. P6-10-X1]|uniref:hypothetical protein n=1 Tax=Brachybacterium sp. P6-10-X1 TaxID=1903186 RepID=UPI000971A541|nr:hypothetical protein [Brachybacterium sp. P6-10-X1]APX33579.1 hypothetical protein BH708_13620 [Brachybacterium sp. P6-10-X1]